MTAREKLKYCYELAFYPPRLNELCRILRRGDLENIAEVGEMLDTALLLHQALPSSGYASQRALNRLALRQAKARAFGMVHFIENLRRSLGRGPLYRTEMPGQLVRDIGLPKLSRHSNSHFDARGSPGRFALPENGHGSKNAATR
jgi:hypothetical protein